MLKCVNVICWASVLGIFFLTESIFVWTIWSRAPAFVSWSTSHHYTFKFFILSVSETVQISSISILASDRNRAMFVAIHCNWPGLSLCYNRPGNFLWCLAFIFHMQSSQAAQGTRGETWTNKMPLMDPRPMAASLGCINHQNGENIKTGM